jgi:hypothetical protein
MIGMGTPRKNSSIERIGVSPVASGSSYQARLRV